MTELERELLQNLITAAWPLPVQVAFGAGLVAVYWVWSRFYYAVIDPALRNVLGGVLGATVVWVERYSAEYPTPWELGFPRNRYLRWTWGIQAEAAGARRCRAAPLLPVRHPAGRAVADRALPLRVPAAEGAFLRRLPPRVRGRDRPLLHLLGRASRGHGNALRRRPPGGVRFSHCGARNSYTSGERGGIPRHWHPGNSGSDR